MGKNLRPIGPRDRWVIDDVTQQVIGISIEGVGNPSSLSTVVGVPVATNRTLAKSDLDQILDVSAAATLTIPKDDVLGIYAADRVTVSAYQQSTGAVAWAAGSGVTLRGTAPTAAQYLVTGLIHVGANEWAYL